MIRVTAITLSKHRTLHRELVKYPAILKYNGLFNDEAKGGGECTAAGVIPATME